MKILILALSGIGDALMFTPALQLLRKHQPEAEIHALVMLRGVKDIYERNENLNKVFFFEFMKEGFVKSFFFINSIRKKYDVSINVYPSNRKEYNIMNFLIGAKYRASVRYLRMDKGNLGFLNNVRITEDDSLHNVQENVLLIQKIFDSKFDEEPTLDFQLTEKDEKIATDYLQQNNLKDNDTIIGFHPGCALLKNHIKRRWEPEKFSSLGKKLIESNKAKILIFGGPDEEELKLRIQKEINSPDAYCVTTKNLAETAAIIKKCKLFITNDSSLMHVASAMHRKVIALIGPTNTNYIYPWKTEHKIASLQLDCSPCFFYSPRPLKCSRDDVQFKCIKELNVDLVFNLAQEYMK